MTSAYSIHSLSCHHYNQSKDWQWHGHKSWVILHLVRARACIIERCSKGGQLRQGQGDPGPGPDLSWPALTGPHLITHGHPPSPAPHIRKSSGSLIKIPGVLAQDDDAASKLCEGKSSGEMFRLQAGKKNCRDVVQCTASVRFLKSKKHCVFTDSSLLFRVFNKSGVLQD